MRNAALAVFFLCSPAFSSPLTLSGVYGTTNACEAYAAGGIEAVYLLNGEGVDFILVSQGKVLGQEWECAPQDTDGERVAMLCYTGGDVGAPTVATIRENIAGRTLAYTDEDAGARILSRCE